MSPAVLSSSYLIYLSNSLTSWEHLVESTFMQYDNNSDYSQLKLNLLKKLTQIKTEFNAKPLNYVDVLTVTFESKTRLVLSIMRVGYIFQLNEYKYI